MKKKEEKGLKIKYIIHKSREEERLAQEKELGLSIVEVVKEEEGNEKWNKMNYFY